MTWKTSETCTRCGAQYEIDVWDLGHKDSDSITCQCCGVSAEKIIRPWVIRTANEDIHLNPEDGWVVCNIIMA